MAEEKDAPEVDVEHTPAEADIAAEAEQTPEEIAEIEAANKERQRNINKIFAILVGICLAGTAVFLAIYISTHNNDSAAGDDGFVTQEMEIPVQGNTGFGPDIDISIQQDNAQ